VTDDYVDRAIRGEHEGQQAVSEGAEHNDLTADKIFFARSNKTPKGWSYDHVGFITQDGKQIQMSGHKGNDVYVTNAVTDDPEFPKQNIKIVSLSKPVSVPTTNSVGAENCGTFVANVLQANGVKDIDTQKIYSVFKQPNQQNVAEGEEIHNYKKLDNILHKLCELVVKGQHSDKDYGMVAAGILDPENKIVARTSKNVNGKWVHAERNAIEAYENKYGEVPEDSIVITTLSPCNEHNDGTAEERMGDSCTDYLNSKGIEKVYCGYMDPTQDNDNREFNIIETSDKKLRHECKKFSDTFLKSGVEENYTMQFASEKTPPVSPYAGVKDNQYRGGISEASGYIPSEKQKNDPRFKTALTVDVHPDSIKKNAKAFYWNTSRAGIPPTAKANGKI
jgi:pyrimidine deaminase RibD-like protein